MKKIIALILALVLVLALAACGTGGGTAEAPSGTDAAETTPAEESAEPPAEVEYDPMVDFIDMTCDDGSITYVRFEKANPGLTDIDDALVFVFDFTNFQTKPSQVQSVFYIQFFQNGVELDDYLSWWSNGSDQDNLVSAFFNDVMKDATVTVGCLVDPIDNSPITVMVTQRDGGDDDYQMMEVDLADDAAGAAGAEPASAEEIDAALQGTWTLMGDNSFTFNNGDISITTNGMLMGGTYEVNTGTSQIDAALTATDGTVNMHLDYTYDNGVLVLKNAQGVELEKQ